MPGPSHPVLVPELESLAHPVLFCRSPYHALTVHAVHVEETLASGVTGLMLLA